MINSVLSDPSGFVTQARRVDCGHGLGAPPAQLVGGPIEGCAQRLILEGLSHPSLVGRANVNAHPSAPVSAHPRSSNRYNSSAICTARQR